MDKRLPPYGSYVKQYIAANVFKNDVIILCGNFAWQKRKLVHPQRVMLVLPPWECPSTYYWPVKGYPVLIRETGYSDTEYIERTAWHLLKDGASVVRYLGLNGELVKYSRE